MCKHSKNMCSSHCLLTFHVVAIFVIATTVVSLCYLCKSKLSDIMCKMKECFSNCKDECICVCGDIMEDLDAGNEETQSE